MNLKIFAVFLFISFLMVLSFAVHSKDTIGFANTILKKILGLLHGSLEFYAKVFLPFYPLIDSNIPYSL